MSDDVTQGEDGWLFLTGGSNSVMRYFEDPEHFPHEKVRAWVDLIRSRAERAAGLGIRYHHLAPPEKLSVYPEFFPKPLSIPDGAPGARLAAALANEPHHHWWRLSFINLLPYFELQKQFAHKLYFKTDTHWTFEGAFAAYQLLCHHLNAEARLDLLQRPVSEASLVLDLGGKFDPPISELFSMRDVQKDSVRHSVNDLVAFKEASGQENHVGMHIGSSVVFRNDKPDVDPRRVILFGDSFSEYRPHMLTGLLAETFAEVHFVWSSQVDWKYVENVAPHILVTELAERFMTYVPSDEGFDLDAYVSEKLAAAASA
ncbi:alginate O-acetyltransferase AlgX-related protein [Caulobacter hibisci]|uniref:AlgX/AlgJ SGNH hydrolase-like domain-containing protein n=1 Tax=Caulobacter hibisci TaxID=2035993 RepID=A0ABS0SUG3_9CAUL|nr:hypothetical protein [Caulobacter hibisci]MBI1683292.1 hypothetical protein [Caulobacter hibisci]